MIEITTTTDARFPRSKRFETHVAIAEPEFAHHSNLRCKVTLTWHPGIRGKVPLFRVSQTNGGLAYPEVLRAYSELLLHVADQLENKAVIDFQI